MKLTEKLDLLLAERGLNKSQLSMQCGVPYTTIVSLYEKGYDNVKRSTLLAIAHFFGVSLDYLADDDVEERAPVVTAAAAHLDPDTLTDEGRALYLSFVEMLAEKYSKGNA